jgi:hypothetical protein
MYTIVPVGMACLNVPLILTNIVLHILRSSFPFSLSSVSADEGSTDGRGGRGGGGGRQEEKERELFQRTGMCKTILLYHWYV